MGVEYPFVNYLLDLREDRGALAALRRGLGKPPGTEAAMYRYVVPWLPQDAPAWRQSAYYLVAALFAYHPAPGGSGNVGNHYARARATEADDTALERRFTTLLAANPDDLDVYLRQAVSFLRSKEVPVNWRQLLHDVLYWGHPDRFVQQSWARAYWGRSHQDQSDNEED